MNASVGIASVLLGLSLTLAGPAGPAAAGRDGDRATAATHTQGRSPSDPDGLSNGGADKPGHTGGRSSDRDSNNGCGNDDDREDDNNGRCGGRDDKPTKRAERAKPAAAPAPATVAVSAAGTSVAAAVLAGADSAAAGAQAAGTSDPLTPVSDPGVRTPASAAAPSDPSGAEVLGAQEERDGSGGPASLPRTGAGLLVLVVAGAALAGTGATLRRFSRGG